MGIELYVGMPEDFMPTEPPVKESVEKFFETREKYINSEEIAPGVGVLDPTTGKIFLITGSTRCAAIYHLNKTGFGEKVKFSAKLIKGNLKMKVQRKNMITEEIVSEQKLLEEHRAKASVYGMDTEQDPWNSYVEDIYKMKQQAQKGQKPRERGTVFQPDDAEATMHGDVE